MSKSENTAVQCLARHGKDVQLILNSQEEALHHYTVVFLASPKSQCFPSLTWTGKSPEKFLKANLQHDEASLVSLKEMGGNKGKGIETVLK